MAKSRAIVVGITALAVVLVVAWLLPTDNPRRDCRLRRSILLRCASDLLFVWRDVGKLYPSDVKGILEAYDQKSDRFVIVWGVDILNRRRPFARVIVEGGDLVERVLLIDLVDKEGGYSVGPDGYRWLTCDELAGELRQSDIELRGDFVAQ